MTDGKEKRTKRKKVGSQPRNQAQLPDVEWVNPSPNSTDLEWLESHADQLPTLVLELFDDMDDTERLSLKVDSYSGRWCAIYFGGQGGGVNKGLALSVRGATTFDALSLLAYFHLVRYSRDWEVLLPRDIGKWG